MWRTAGGGAVTCPDGADVYTSAKGVLTSDHLPVVARIEARVRGARDAALGDGTHARPRAARGHVRGDVNARRGLPDRRDVGRC
jgi:hypothetical protein